MHWLLMILCFLGFFPLEAQPHLILHFDVNKTLIASDKTENKSIEDVINELLSRKYAACWDPSVKEPISFDAYVRTVLMPGHEHDGQLKMDRLFHLIHFIDYLYEHHHELYPVVLNEFNLVMGALKGMEGNIFPSFFHLINHLNQKKISYTLFLRSFGQEVFEVKHEINQHYPHLLQIEGTFQKGILCLKDKKPMQDADEIYNFFLSRTAAAIRDDWKYWMNGKMDAKFGKLFYINPTDKNVLPIFFDDNIKPNDAKQNIIASIDINTGKIVPISNLLQTKQLVAVDTLEAILNDLYYIEFVEEALQIFNLGREGLITH